jgi:hypothetical protein
VASSQEARIRPSPQGQDAISRLHCWPSNDVQKLPVRRRADAVPGRPIRLPRRGRQRLSWPGGYEAWVGEDGDLEAAWGITPARFLFERALPQLVELPALWTSIPLAERDVEDVLAAINCIVTDHALPEPHLIVSDSDRVVVLWHIRPLHYPAALKAGATDDEKAHHDRQTYAFRRCLRDWKRAAVKLRLAFAGAGALPHTPASVEQQLLEFIPFPLDPGHPASRVEALDADPPRVWRTSDHGPVLIKDVSMALAAFDQGMWATFKEARPRRGRATAWMQSEATLAALATTEAGDRHKAALTIVCACVWDGLPQDEALRTLREWASRCVQDGTFPWRRHQGDELELLVAWAYKRLSPGGPTPRDPTGNGGPDGGGSGGRRGLTPCDAAAAAILAFVAAEAGPDGLVAATLPELRREAALERLTNSAAGSAAPISRTTLKRALATLKARGLLEQEVVRVGRTWCSRFRLPTGPGALPEAHISDAAAPPLEASAGAIGASASMAHSRVQKRESLWAPSSPRGSIGGGLGDTSPSGRGVRGEGPAPSATAGSEEPSGFVEPVDAPESGGEPGLHELPASVSASPETSLLAEASSVGARGPRVRRPRTPRLLPLPFFEAASPTGERQRRRRRRDELPPLTDAVVEELRHALIDGTVRPHRLAAGLPDILDDAALRAVLEEARDALTPRPRLKDRFADALKRQAQRLLRLEAFAEVSRQHAAARKTASTRPPFAPLPAPSPAPSPSSSPSSSSSEPPANPFAALYAAQQRPLHELHPIERARRLVAHELSLVVLAPRSKEPPARSSWTSAQVTRPRLPVLQGQLEAQHEQTGDEAGLAIVCGPVSGVIAVDLDDASAVAWAQKHLPETPWRTKTGRGEHWFYRLPDGWTPPPGPLPYKGQLQAAGRYVVAPGSIHPYTGGRYEALGDWTRTKSELPNFRNEWLLDPEARRRQRLAIIKSET